MLFRYFLITLLFLLSLIQAQAEESISTNITVDEYCAIEITPDPKDIPILKGKEKGRLAFSGKPPKSNIDSKNFTCSEQYNFSGLSSSYGIPPKDLETYCICKFCKKNPHITGEICEAKASKPEQSNIRKPAQSPPIHSGPGSRGRR